MSINQKTDNLVSWVKLNANPGNEDVRLVVAGFPSGVKRLVLVTGDEEFDESTTRNLSDIGFYRSRSGLWMRDNLRFTLPEILRAFPRAVAAKLPVREIRRIASEKHVDVAEKGVTPSVAVNNAVMAAIPVGMNHLRQLVYQGEDGRFVHDESGNVVREDPSSPGAVFLYAHTDDDLALCADGFVGEMASGKIFRFDDLKRFASAITGIPADEILHSVELRNVQESIEAAMVRYIRHHGSRILDGGVFNLAMRLEEAQPPYLARTSDSVGLQQYSTALPISIAVQRVLGNVDGKDILEPTIGNGALICRLGGARVFGFDLDVKRLANVRREFKEAVVAHADAARVDFKGLNQGMPYDMIVSNPPFGGLSTSQSINGLKVTRIDHLILMRSLAARKDDGLGVYIIGADSVIGTKAGHVTGGSRYLFNWLSDHYDVDVIEVDGGMFAKQGASFPVRLVVVGKKGSGYAPVPDVLPVIREYDELFDWSTRMHKKYVLDAISLEEPGPDIDVEVPDFGGAVSSPAEEKVRRREKTAPLTDELPVSPAEAGEAEAGVAPEVAAEEPASAAADDKTDVSQEPVAAGAPPPLNISDQEENSYQSPYSSYSRVGEATAMIPRNMSTPTRMALAEVEDEYGDVDIFVAGELGWSVTEMSEKAYLSPEQVDAVALAISSIKRGRALLEADQTGLGKGRVMAAMARYAALNNKRVVFITETPTLFTDFWRDVRDIGSEDLFTPLIVNDGVSVFDPISGGKLIPATPKSVIDSALRNNAVDDRYNLVLGTYSQFNRDRAASAKSRWISQIAEGAALLLDEAHNAAGESNTGKNIGLAVDVADMVVYSSATSMKSAKNVMLYSKLFPATVDMGTLPETLDAGGEVLQEVLSGMLARDGVFIRREHDLSNLTFRTVEDKEREERNRDLSDKLAEILEYMNYLAGDINHLVNERNKEIRELLEGLPAEERSGNRMGAISVNFGSRLFAIYRQFMMALKTDLAAERAIKMLIDGKKPVIVLENTMEMLLNDIVLQNRPDVLDAEDMADLDNVITAMSGETDLGGGLTFRDVLYRMLDRLTYFNETGRYGDVTKRPVTSDESRETLSMIRGLIDDFPDLPISPLDEIRQRIEESGYVCDELSGRKLRIEKRPDTFVAAPIIERPKAQIVKDFVTGASDALLLTRAGSTGISLHASEKFPDQRQRVMIELQSAADVNVRVQFFGRVNRKGQTSSPEIETLSSGLIGEARPIAMQNAKLRKLSANTTANQDNAALDRTVPDFINSIGDEVAYRYLEANPAIAARLDIDMDNDGEREESYFINKLTSRLVMLRVAEQEQIYAALTNEYVRVIKELDAKGINPLKSREMDVRSREIGREVFESGNPHSDSVFDQPVYVKTIEYDVKVEPLRAEDVKKKIAIGADMVMGFEINREGRKNQDFFLALKAFLAANRNRFMESVLGKEFKTVEEALGSKKVNAVQKMLQRLRVLDTVLDGLHVGAVARFTNDDGEMDFGIVTRVAVPENPKHIHLLGAYEISFAVPGKQALVERSMYSLQDDVQFRIMPKGSMESELFAKFDAAKSGMVTYRRLILDGNLFKAAQIAGSSRMGSSVIYTDESGNRHRGVLLARGVSMNDLKSLPVRMEAPVMCIELLKAFPNLQLSSTASGAHEDGMDVSLRLQDGMAVLEVPGTKSAGSRFFGNDELIKATGPFAGSRAMMTAKFPVENMGAALRELYYGTGISFYAPSSYREAINELNKVVYTNKSCTSKDNDSRIGPKP